MGGLDDDDDDVTKGTEPHGENTKLYSKLLRSPGLRLSLENV